MEEEKVKKRRGRKNKPPGTGGAPSKFKPEFCQMVIDFFSIEPNFIKEIVTEGSGKSQWKKVEYKIFANKLPTMLRFAMSIGVHDETLENWAKKENQDKYVGEVNGEKMSFFAAYSRARTLYKEFICHNALVGVHNPIFAKFMLINTTDMKDVQFVEENSKRTLTLKTSVAKMSPEQINQALQDKIMGNKPAKRGKV